MQTVLVMTMTPRCGHYRAHARKARGPRAGRRRQDRFQQALTLKPDLLLVDLRMPGLSGIEVCKQIRAAGMKTPLIVLSAIGEEMDKVLLLEIGADDYVVKPFGTRELLARIRALLRRSSADASKVPSSAMCKWISPGG